LRQREKKKKQKNRLKIKENKKGKKILFLHNSRIAVYKKVHKVQYNNPNKDLQQAVSHREVLFSLNQWTEVF
jgi:shikimate kinase